MSPEKKAQLTKFTQMAKAIIYEPKRMQKFMEMMGSEEGAVMAAKTVVGAIEQQMPVPPEVAPLVAVNAYMLMVDMAQEVMELEPSPEIVRRVITAIYSEMSAPQQRNAPTPAQPSAPQGLISQGVA